MIRLQRLGFYRYRKGRGWWGVAHRGGFSLGWDYRELLLVGIRWDFPLDSLVFLAFGFRLTVAYELMWRVGNGLLGMRIRESQSLHGKER